MDLLCFREIHNYIRDGITREIFACIANLFRAVKVLCFDLETKNMTVLLILRASSRLQIFLVTRSLETNADAA